MGGAEDSPLLPPEVFLRIGEVLKLDEQLRTLSTLLATSRSIHSLLGPTLYADLVLTDDQLHRLVTHPKPVSHSCTRYTRSLIFLTPLSNSTASALISLPHPPFPVLETLTLTSAVLRALPHDKPALSSYDTSRSFKKRCAALTSHLGPFRHLNITPAKGAGAEDECVFEILHPILPTSLGLSSFLPRLAALHPPLEVVRYDRFHADLVYPTSGVNTEYRDVCGCWLKYGAERLGLGLRLAWAGETPGLKGGHQVERITMVEIHTSGSEPRGRWDAFQDRVLEYVQEGGEDLAGRVERRGGVDRLRCLSIVHAGPS